MENLISPLEELGRYPNGRSEPNPFPRGNFMRLARLLIHSFIGGIASFALLRFLATILPSSFVADTVDSLGALYGTLLFATGLFAISASFAKDLSTSSDEAVMGSRWVVFMPVIVGFVGVFHGYLSMAPYYSTLPDDIAIPHNTVWATVTLGALLTIAATAVAFSRQCPNAGSSSFER